MASLCESLGIRADSGKVHRLTIDGMDDEEAKAILNERLEVDSKGNLEKTLKNAQLILKYDPELRCFLERAIVTESRTSKKSKSSILSRFSVVRFSGFSLLHALKAFCAWRKISSMEFLVFSFPLISAEFPS